jgi:hypothetical protein
MARNAIHQRFERLILATQQVSKALSNPETKDLLSTISTNVNQLPMAIYEAIEPLIEEAKEDIIKGFNSKPSPNDVTQEAFDCIRILSQIQDLVTDKEFVLDTNNETLTKLRCSSAYNTAFNQLSESEAIQNRFQNAFRDFKTDEFTERAKRLIEILGLYNDLIRTFASERSGGII